MFLVKYCNILDNGALQKDFLAILVQNLRRVVLVFAGSLEIGMSLILMEYLRA
jgi:hypothetical protein